LTFVLEPRVLRDYSRRMRAAPGPSRPWRFALSELIQQNIGDTLIKHVAKVGMIVGHKELSFIFPVDIDPFRDVSKIITVEILACGAEVLMAWAHRRGAATWSCLTATSVVMIDEKPRRALSVVLKVTVTGLARAATEDTLFPSGGRNRCGGKLQNRACVELRLSGGAPYAHGLRGNVSGSRPPATRSRAVEGASRFFRSMSFERIRARSGLFGCQCTLPKRAGRVRTSPRCTHQGHFQPPRGGAFRPGVCGGRSVRIPAAGLASRGGSR
jgi:hypothetical protein